MVKHQLVHTLHWEKHIVRLICVGQEKGLIHLLYIAQNFGDRKLRRFTINPPKFYLPTTFISTDLLWQAASPPVLCISAKTFLSSNSQKFCAVQYIRNFVQISIRLRVATDYYFCYKTL